MILNRNINFTTKIFAFELLNSTKNSILNRVSELDLLSKSFSAVKMTFLNEIRETWKDFSVENRTIMKKCLEFIAQQNKNYTHSPIFNQFKVSLGVPALTYCGPAVVWQVQPLNTRYPSLNFICNVQVLTPPPPSPHWGVTTALDAQVFS